jgi:TolB-like protein
MKIRNPFASRQFCLAMALLCVGGFCHAEPGPPIRLAIVSEATALPAADFLTAELSKDGRLALLERDQIDKVINEQALALSAGANKDYLKVGELLGADGLLILTLVEKEDRQMVSCRLVAVKPGVELGLADYDFPLSDPGEWSKLLADRFAPLLSKLTVLRQDAVPLSILNLRSAAASVEGEVLERQLTLLLHDRLMTERNLFVLERRSMETLAGEKGEKPVSENPFWNGSYLIEGTVDPQGFNSNQVTVDIQITPPDKKNVIALEVSGARSNLTQVINEAASRITGAVGKGSANTTWSADDEAERYFKEAQWMLRWGMFQEAKAASEAAWALGKQTRPAAELRIKAYQACGGDPGSCMVKDKHVIFLRPPKAGVMGLNGYWDFASAPNAPGFSASLHAAELWMDEIHRLPALENKADSSRYGLGAASLEQCSLWLRYFYFNTEARAGVEDDIRHARQLCREMSQALVQQADEPRSKELLRAIAKHAVFWAETPEETLRNYGELLDKGQWPAVRERFFNEAYKEGASSVTGHQASERADQCSPCLAGWDWKTRQRCPELWRGFIDEICASPKPLIQLEGLILRCSYSWSDADFKSSVARLRDFIRQQIDADAVAGLDEKLAKDLQALVDVRLDGYSVEAREQAMGGLAENFKRELEALLNKRRQAAEAQKTRATQEAEFEVKETYLKSQTNFDFMSFAKVLLNKNYSAEEADRLLPLVTNYHERIKSLTPGPDASQQEVMKARMNQSTANIWIPKLEEKLKNVISPSPPATNTQPAGLRQSSPNAAQTPSSLAEKPFSSIKSLHFWKLPAEEDDNQGASHRGYIISACYRDGRLWVQEFYESVEMSGRTEFYGVDLKTFATQHVAFRDDQYSFWQAMTGFGENRFDVDTNYLYLWLKDSARRYSFAKQTWEGFPMARDGRPQRLGNRLFFTTPVSIHEYLPDGSLQLLASCRRRPAVTALDNLDNYTPCHLFLDPAGRVNVCVSNEVYTLSNTNDWQHSASLPTANYSEASLFDNGFVLPLLDQWWGMVTPSQKPELLFRRSRLNSPGYVQFHPPVSQETPAPRWNWPPPASHPCLDGDCLWFIADPLVLDFFPRPSLKSSQLTLVRYKYNEPRACT